MRRIRLRRPRFALVLIAILAPIGIVLALTAHQTSSPGNPAPVIASGPARSCVTAHAAATATAHATATASASASIPVTVTETARTRTAIVSATRSETVVEQARLTRQLAVRQTLVVAHHSCASGSTKDAAHSIALQRAYAIALTQARPKAMAAARRHLAALISQDQPGLQADAQKLADARATAAAATARTTLGREALADARGKAKS